MIPSYSMTAVAASPGLQSPGAGLVMLVAFVLLLAFVVIARFFGR